MVFSFKSMVEMKRIGREFFERDAEQVARELLGMILVRKLKDGRELRARIVETEAYFGEEDPASRACKKGDLRETMKLEGGRILVYGVHNNWLINFVTGKKGDAEAVLLRALEPLNFQEKTKGPGLLTRALEIDKMFHKKIIIDCEEIFVLDDGSQKEIEVIERFRIGVKRDLKKPMRFYIKDSKYVSKK